MPEWHATFERMRGVTSARSWMTWAEFDGLLRTVGVALSPYHVCRAVAVDRPAVVAGAKRYEQRHLRLAVEYAVAKGLARRQR